MTISNNFSKIKYIGDHPHFWSIRGAEWRQAPLTMYALRYNTAHIDLISAHSDESPMNFGWIPEKLKSATDLGCTFKRPKYFVKISRRDD
jgi:hypothetical protein